MVILALFECFLEATERVRVRVRVRFGRALLSVFDSGK